MDNLRCKFTLADTSTSLGLSSVLKPNCSSSSKRIRRNYRGETPLHIAAIKVSVIVIIQAENIAVMTHVHGML